MIKKSGIVLLGIVFASASVGCGNGANPTAPTGAVTSGAAPIAAASRATIAISGFTLTGWYSGQKYHYVPTLSVTETTRTSGAFIQSLSFTWVQTGTVASGIKYNAMPHVAAGASLGLLNNSNSGPIVEITSAVRSLDLSVAVSFVDDAGRAGQVTATVRTPTVPEDDLSAALSLSSFAVEGWYDPPRFHYWPKLSLTSGGVAVAIRKIAFELLDVGSAGRVPPSWQPFAVTAGGTLNLSDSPYGDAWLEIDSSAKTSGVSVVIVFIDEAGRAGEITAVTGVSWH